MASFLRSVQRFGHGLQSFYQTVSLENSLFTNRTLHTSIKSKVCRKHCMSSPSRSVLLNEQIFIRIPPVRHAGHAKWQNIKADKEKGDKKASAARSKYASLIRGVLKQGGAPDISKNPELAKLFAKALNDSIPKKTLENILESVKKQGELFDVELAGPSGSVLIVRIAGKTRKMAEDQVRSAIKKYMARVPPKNMAQHVFEHKGIIRVSVKPEDKPVNIDKFLEVAIEVGAEDVIVVENEDKEPELQFHCGVSQVSMIRQNLETEGLEVLSGEEEYIPLVWADLSPSDVENIEQLVQKLYRNPEVERVFDNITPLAE